MSDHHSLLQTVACGPYVPRRPISACIGLDDERVEWSWARTLAEVDDARARAGRIVGLRLAAVRYYTLDCAEPDDLQRSAGIRHVTSSEELSSPVWRYPFGDSVDYGVEFETACCRWFTVTWDSPGWHEGIWLRECRLATETLVTGAAAAVWDVSQAGRWDRYLGLPVSDVRLAYRPWAPGDGYWCSRITIVIGDDKIELLLGEGEADDALHPSADNVAVLFPPANLPDWELR